MNREIRKKYILEKLDKKGYINVKDITKKCNISHMTARRDLIALEKKGYLIRNHGGAIKSEAVDNLFSFSNRVETKKEEKDAICRYAAHYIEDNDTIFIDCGTTLFRLCKYIINRKNIRVITNSLPVLSELINYSNIEINILGGEVFPERKAIYGPVTEKAISGYRVDKAFIGVDGISLHNGLSSYDQKEANITRKMAERADKVYLLCDSSKIENDSCYLFAPLSIVDFLITSKDINRKYIKEYQKNKIKILID